MRIIAGSLKGRRLKAPDWNGLRPTSDKLRETLFNVLAPRLAGARVADLYAGTGAIGLEAISRGAVEVTFVERDRRAQALIAANVAHCGVASGCVIIRASVEQALEAWRRAARRFDIVLMDPPYDVASDSIAEVIAAAADVLVPEGVLVLEHARRRASPAAAGAAGRTRLMVSGDSALSLYSCQP